ncbi:hypothetical protein TKWG_07120 [Advenella kashmirensis WT001]|uniref:Uncharacterized protein n=1 Tax=Advenella kashmirensis (strain DSM 17095 / LMG 22695 / WT001) TaxID=1036672 RepID=I3UA19_ADVKW|nr:hypothetical protein TKWG_07120 [Advenella kashmirensis WT001]
MRAAARIWARNIKEGWRTNLAGFNRLVVINHYKVSFSFRTASGEPDYNDSSQAFSSEAVFCGGRGCLCSGNLANMAFGLCL